MAEFDDKLNALLSDPNSMAQIMQLAQSLGAGGGGGTPPQSPPPQGGFGSPPQGNVPPQGGFGFPPQESPPPQGGNPLSSLLGSIDPKTIARLMPLVQELGSARNSNNQALLYALRPYLKTERQDKIERALQLARLIHIGKKFLAGWEG